ncbi:MAG: DDE-type integrase/transposase/recombinase [Candidatus Rokubacteria bacterium]|nr:DDE-type integrase/transposase/recombinase [Candidatus Rokubacteria bacterium]
MNRLPAERRAQVLSMIAEGNSLRATSRMADVAFNTVVKLLLDVGEASERYQDQHVGNVKARRIQCDEIWAFVYAKNKNVPEAHKGELGYGDVWTWTALDAETKLLVTWAIGRRDGFTAQAFIRDLADRLATRVQLTTDGHKVYLEAVEGAFGNAIDYAMLIKMYEGDATVNAPAERRYSPARCTGSREQTITGNPDPDHISTSYVERQNLTMRMHMRRFTRLTNAFSKKLDNHKAAVAFYAMWYNFARIHQTLRVTPAMEAGISDHVWSAEEIARLTN